MKKFLSISVFILSGLFSNSQNCQWAHNIGSDWGSAQGIVTVDIAVDANNNTIVAGSFIGTADFDPGSSVASLTAGPQGNGFIAKYDAAGNFLWAKNLLATSVMIILDFALDNNGNIFVGGYFNDTCDFDPGNPVANLVSGSNGSDMFIAKYDNNGNYLWANKFGGTDDLDQVERIVTDDSGNVIVTGGFKGTVDFDPGAGTYNLVNGNFNSEYFFAKYDGSGNLIWAKHIASQKLYTDIAVKNNNVYLCGSFNQTVDFDPGSGTANLSVGSAYSWFFAKYDSAGNYVYAKYLNNSSGTSNLIYGGNGIAIDDNENTYLFGNFTTTVDFDPGAGTANLTASLSTAMYLAKYDATGNYLWAKNLDIDGSSAGYISFDNSGNILLTGNYFSTGDFDPNAGIAIQNTVPTGVHNMFLAKYDVNGNYIAATSFGGYLQDYAAGMAVDDADNIYLSGTMLSDTCDFEPGAGELLLTKSSSGIMFNVFYAKYGPLFPSAIDETESLPFKIYPNPSSGKFVVELNLTSSAPFQITDITGKKITEGIFSAQKNEIGLSNAASGVYFLKINSVTIKLMKH